MRQLLAEPTRDEVKAISQAAAQEALERWLLGESWAEIDLHDDYGVALQKLSPRAHGDWLAATSPPPARYGGVG